MGAISFLVPIAEQLARGELETRAQVYAARDKKLESMGLAVKAPLVARKRPAACVAPEPPGSTPGAPSPDHVGECPTPASSQDPTPGAAPSRGPDHVTPLVAASPAVAHCEPEPNVWIVPPPEMDSLQSLSLAMGSWIQ